MIPAAAMLACTWRWGWASEEELRGLVFSFRNRPADDDAIIALQPLPSPAGTWLDASREQMGELRTYPLEIGSEGPRWHQRPAVWTWAFLVVVGFVNFVVLW